MARIQENKPKCTGVFQIFGPITSANISLAKRSHVTKVKGLGNVLCLAENFSHKSKGMHIQRNRGSRDMTVITKVGDNSTYLALLRGQNDTKF